ncbi:SDR family oxidoreductase [Deltaproteobacteria bacterium TL4]
MEQKKDLRTVIITGGTKGIGACIAKKFLQEGWFVLIASRQDNGLASELGNHARFQAMDVRHESDHQQAINAVVAWTGQLDAYINCAGFSQWRPIDKVDDAFWGKMIDTNLKGSFWGCKIASQSLTKNGCIVNVSSLAGKRGSLNNSVYCASKFGVNALTQSLAKELGPKGIRVNAVCPVYVETEGVFEALEDSYAPPQGEDIPTYLQKFALSNAALQRLPRGAEVADLCFYLTSSQSSAITGQCINVDCGVLPQ